jgi:hypothetical protein
MFGDVSCEKVEGELNQIGPKLRKTVNEATAGQLENRRSDTQSAQRQIEGPRRRPVLVGIVAGSQ